MIDDDLTTLDEGLRRLKIEYHIFFSGHRAKPPDDLRMRVERIIKQLSENAGLSFSQRFRFNTLVTRFYVYRDLWRRTQQDREMGTDPIAAPSPESASVVAPQNKAAETVRVSISDPKAEEEKVRALYEALLHLKGTETQETDISYSQFAKYIATQTKGLREKYGCPRVAFTIALQNDAIRFTAVAEKC